MKKENENLLLIVFGIIVILILLFVGMRISNPDTKSDSKVITLRDTVFITKTIIRDMRREIVVVPAMVAHYCGKEYVTRGSAVFEYGEQQKGYIIFIKKDGKVLDRIVCKQSDLKQNIDWIKYEMPIDTIITTSK